MKITALAAISTISAVSAQLQSKPLRGHGNGKDHPEDDAALKARVLEEAGSVASMVQGAGEYMWDGGWKPKPTTTEAVTTATDEWAGWGKPSAKSDKWHPVWSAGGKTRITEFPVDERPEGITEGPESTLFVSQILSGRVLAIDAATGETKEVVGEQIERQAWGLWYYKGKIFVAGGGSSFGGGKPEVYVYDAETGNSIVSCAPLSINTFGDFLNDVTIREGVAYITDSVNGKLMAMDAEEALAGKCVVSEVDLPDNFDPIEKDDFGANGVVPYANGLLVSHEIDGSVWLITDLDNTSPTFQEVIPDDGAPGADGLTIVEDRLYVTQNFVNEIGVWKLYKEDGGGVHATKLGKLTSSAFDTPATSAAFEGYIYSTNSRFVELPDISAPADDNVIGVKDTFAKTAWGDSWASWGSSKAGKSSSGKSGKDWESSGKSGKWSGGGWWSKTPQCQEYCLVGDVALLTEEVTAVGETRVFEHANITAQCGSCPNGRVRNLAWDGGWDNDCAPSFQLGEDPAFGAGVAVQVDPTISTQGGYTLPVKVKDGTTSYLAFTGIAEVSSGSAYFTLTGGPPGYDFSSGDFSVSFNLEDRSFTGNLVLCEH